MKLPTVPARLRRAGPAVSEVEFVFGIGNQCHRHYRGGRAVLLLRHGRRRQKRGERPLNINPTPVVACSVTETLGGLVASYVCNHMQTRVFGHARASWAALRPSAAVPALIRTAPHSRRPGDVSGGKADVSPVRRLAPIQGRSATLIPWCPSRPPATTRIRLSAPQLLND